MTITIYVTFPKTIPPKGWFAHTGQLYSYTVESAQINQLIKQCFDKKCTSIEIGSIYQKIPLDK